MVIVFVSGFLNNHILPLCDEFAKKSEFYFIATQKDPGFGFNRNVIERSYVVPYYEYSEKTNAEQLICECDAAIFGGSSDELLKIRKTTGKLSFVYTERLFKKGDWRRFIPKTKKIFSQRFLVDNNNLYVLCAGAFVKDDLRLIGFDGSKCFKFGYFPITIPVNNIDKSDDTDRPDCYQLLYVGRLIRWKRVQDAIRCARKLINCGYNVKLTIIGDGPERNRLEHLTACLNLYGAVDFYGEKDSFETQAIMQRSDVLFLTSDRNEGWGAVVNEALNNGCPVVVSETCGSAGYLIKDGFNGYVYKTGRITDMAMKTANLLIMGNRVKKQARRSICDSWNESIAVERFLKLCDCILGNQTNIQYDEGPMSMA